MVHQSKTQRKHNSHTSIFKYQTGMIKARTIHKSLSLTLNDFHVYFCSYRFIVIHTIYLTETKQRVIQKHQYHRHTAHIHQQIHSWTHTHITYSLQQQTRDTLERIYTTGIHSSHILDRFGVAIRIAFRLLGPNYDTKHYAQPHQPTHIPSNTLDQWMCVHTFNTRCQGYLGGFISSIQGCTGGNYSQYTKIIDVAMAQVKSTINVMVDYIKFVEHNARHV